MVKHLLAWLLVASSLACAGSTPPVVVQPPSGSATLTVSKISPEPGSKVRSHDVVRADLVFAIPEGFPGDYTVFAQFATTTPNATSDGTYPGRGSKVPSCGSGTVSLDFPLKHVIGNREIALPLKMWFYLSIRTGPGSHAVIAMAGPYEFEVR